MPTFPTYNGELPSSLNPLNFRHWLLLAYWIYFRPTALKCYLYQADSELYRAGAGWKIFDTWKTPGYRNIFLTIPATCLLLSIPFGLVSRLLLKPTNFSLSHYLIGLSIGVTIGLLFGALFGIILGLSVGVARGTTVGIITALAGGVGHSIVISVVFSINQQPDLSYLFTNLPVGISLGMAAGVIVCLGVSVVLGGAVGVAIGVVFGAVAGVSGSLIFSILSSSFPIDSNASYLAFAIEFGLVAMGSLGAGVGFAESVVTVLVCGAAVSLAIGIKTGLISGSIAGFFAILLAWRIPIYFIEFCLALLSQNKNVIALLAWDELWIFPLPKMQQACLQLLEENELEGWQHIFYLACNPFQRWAVQIVLKTYLHKQDNPIHFIYHSILNNKITDAYISPPLTEQGWKQLPKIEKLLLGEISSKWVDCTADAFNQQLEHLVYILTELWRDRSETTLTSLVGLLYQLLDQEIIDPEKLNLSNYRDCYTGLSNYTGGIEIDNSFTLMASFLSCEQLSDLPTKASEVLALSSGETAIRPTVLKALNSLRDITREIAIYTTASSRINQQSALLRANEDLELLDKYTIEEVKTPEKAIICRIIHEWIELVSEAGGKLGRQESLRRIINPYIAGNPVTGSLFVGREDIMRRLEELWMSPGQVSSVILYGQRRIGKSSILQNLEMRFGNLTEIVYFNMQIAAHGSSISDLLYALAWEIYDNLSPEKQEVLGEPQIQEFTTENHYFAFKRFLTRLDKVRDGRRFIIAVDEYELLEDFIEEKSVEQKLIWFWRGLIQTYPWFIMIFAGLHRLNELSHDYWNPLFASMTPIRVSFISRGAARKLITQPSPDFDIDYDDDAVEKIIDLTNGQPYLVQLICRHLITNFNQQVFEEEIKREKRFTVEDVKTIINDPDFFIDGNPYFTGVWQQAEKNSPVGQLEIIRELCHKELSKAQLVEKTNLTLEEVEAAFKILRERDVIREQDGHYGYTIKLMEKWVEISLGQND